MTIGLKPIYLPYILNKKFTQSMKKFTFLALAFFGVFTMNAQRDVDFAVQSIVKPDVITHQTAWSFHFVGVNNGPDPLVSGDTIFFRLQIANLVYPDANPGVYAIQIINKTLNQGDTVNVITNFNPLNVTGDFDDTSRVIAFAINRSLSDSIMGENATVANNYMQRVTHFDGVNAGIKNGIEEGKFTSAVYPNPASTETFVTFLANPNMEYLVRVYDINGKEVALHNGTTVADENKVRVDLSNIEAGVYFYEVNVGGSVSNGKFAIKK